MSFGTVQAEKMTTESGYSLGAGNASSFKNRLINPSFLINQRNGTNAVTTSALQSSTYFSDRWYYYVDQTSKMSLTQSTDAPAGFTSSTLVTVLATDSTGPEQMVRQKIEGYNMADLGWGASGAKPVVLSFWVKSSLTGQFGGSLQTDTGSIWSYPFSYTVNAANTWEQKIVYVTGPTSGTFGTTNNTGAIVSFEFGPGYQAASPNAWLNSNSTTATGSQNLCATLGATIKLTGVQFEVGTVATSFDFRSYGTELQLCQRYFQVLMSGQYNDAYMATNRSSSGTTVSCPIRFVQTMRSAPTVPAPTVTDLRANGRYGDTGFTGGTTAINDINVRSCLLGINSPTASGYTFNLGESLYINSQTATSNIMTASAEL